MRDKLCSVETQARTNQFEALAAFITEHCGDDPDRLALQKAKWPEIDVAAAVSTLVSRRKLAGKAPLWAASEGLVLPRTLSAEQCSGEAAARHKAAVAARIMTEQDSQECSDGCSGARPGNAPTSRQTEAESGITRPRIADLTGGLGVDCLEFSRVAEAVLYNEMLPGLAAAAEHNFRILGAGNIEVCCFEAGPETLSGGNSEMMLSGRDVRQENDAADIRLDNGALDNSSLDNGALDNGALDNGSYEAPRDSLRLRLEEFRPDIVFLDPARRDGCGKKVFLLEDCSPDILKIKDMLLDIAPVLMLKLSPMADISMVLERLGGECSELHVIESGGECKELLVLMRRGGKADDCLIKVYNLDREDDGIGDDGIGDDGTGDDGIGDDSPVFEFRRSEERTAERNGDGWRLSGRPVFAESEEIVPGALLFEPGKAFMKAGCFSLVGRWLGAVALGRDTHYYILRGNTPDLAAEIYTTQGPSAATETSPAKGPSAATGAYTTQGSSAAPETSPAAYGEHFGGHRSLKDSGKLFRILDVAELSGKGVRDFARRHPEAEVTARNVRMSSEELRKRLGCRPSDRHHIFALHADRPDRNLLLFTERI